MIVDIFLQCTNIFCCWFLQPDLNSYFLSAGCICISLYSISNYYRLIIKQKVLLPSKHIFWGHEVCFFYKKKKEKPVVCYLSEYSIDLIKYQYL